MAKTGSKDRHETSPWEWVLGAVSMVLILGLLGYFGVQALSTEPGVPVVHASARAVRPQGDVFLVEVDLRNSGEATAAGLTLEGVLLAGDSVVERSRLTLDYLPAGGHQQLGLFFRRDPRELRLEVRAHGYQRP